MNHRMSSVNSRTLKTTSVINRRHLVTENSAYESELETSVSFRSDSILRRPTISGLPHTLVYRPSEERQMNLAVRPNLIVYNAEKYEIVPFISAERISPVPNNERLWVNVNGIHDGKLLESLGKRFQMHSLVIEDIEKTEQRTKLDVFDDGLFLVVKLIYYDLETKKTLIEQMSFYLKENVLLTFQETAKDMFKTFETRIRENRGRVRRSKIDYLFYLLLDRIVDSYMDVLENVNTKVHEIEANLMKHLSRDTLETIYDLKREMLFYRSSISPLKEIIVKLQKEEETQIIQEETLIYLRDLYDHVAQVSDTIDNYREMLRSFIDFYMMLNSNAMNEVMKTLTIISTIFIPLTFIAGLYGMNFDNMPEINWKYGYFVVLAVMVSLTFIMLFCFRRRRWF